MSNLLETGEAVEGKGNGIVINFCCDDIDSLAVKVRQAGADIEEGPVIRPWNAKELVLRDPDGSASLFQRRWILTKNLTMSSKEFGKFDEGLPLSTLFTLFVAHCVFRITETLSPDRNKATMRTKILVRTLLHIPI